MNTDRELSMAIASVVGDISTNDNGAAAATYEAVAAATIENEVAIEETPLKETNEEAAVIEADHTESAQEPVPNNERSVENENTSNNEPEIHPTIVSVEKAAGNEEVWTRLFKTKHSFRNMTIYKKIELDTFINTIYKRSTNITLSFAKKNYPVKRWAVENLNNVFAKSVMGAFPDRIFKFNDDNRVNMVSLTQPRVTGECVDLTYSTQSAIKPVNLEELNKLSVVSMEKHKKLLNKLCMPASLLTEDKKKFNEPITMDEATVAFYKRVHRIFQEAVAVNQTKARKMLHVSAKLGDLKKKWNFDDATEPAAVVGPTPPETCLIVWLLNSPDINNKSLLISKLEYNQHFFLFAPQLAARQTNDFILMISGGARIYIMVDYEFFAKLQQIQPPDSGTHVLFYLTALEKNNIPYDLYVQRPGTLVIIKKNVYYNTVDIGDNIYEHVHHPDVDQALLFQLECSVNKQVLNTIEEAGVQNVYTIRRYNPELRTVCSVCNKRFLTNLQLNNHITRLHDRNTQACRYCDSQFSDANKLLIHELRHQVETTDCLICNKPGDNNKSWLSHVKAKHRITITASAHLSSKQWLEDYLRLAVAVRDIKNMGKKMELFKLLGTEEFQEKLDQTAAASDDDEEEEEPPTKKKKVINDTVDDDEDDDEEPERAVQIKTRHKCMKCKKNINALGFDRHVFRCVGASCPFCGALFFSEKTCNNHIPKCKKNV
ncbi:JmjC domain-containing protein (JMJD) [Cotesia congregata filamentous virus 1]|uniref:JmjC domain-containing protein (JMJD) n=1 Tax=Cotesia congregata filamentous virus 1 TaxID=3064291 RepID=A0ABC8QKS4_9VIRU|nr:JmjC domain-containing protein (JMJD) [Cotesia congregata filamentous virus 1]